MNTKTYYVIGDDYNDNGSFGDTFLFGWSSYNDDFEHGINIYELLDEHDRLLPVVSNSCIELNDDLSVYISTDLRQIEEICKQLDGYDFTICKLIETDDELKIEPIK